MSEELEAQRELTEDLLARLVDPRENVRETAAEALAVSTEDEDWRPDDLILGEGIGIITDLLGDRNIHIVRSAIAIIIAIATAGEEEALVSHGVIERLDRIQDHKDPLIREKVHEALWLLTPEVEDVVASKTQDEY
ncbi:MAG: hypothetical protein ABSD81_01485 [Methanomicrobiales archaeon]|jgi:hypothetical protein